jgi:rRNA maturation endonuclease Nob1
MRIKESMTIQDHRYQCAYCRSVLGTSLDEVPARCPKCGASTLKAKSEMVEVDPTPTPG